MGAIRLDRANIFDNMRNYYNFNYDLFANVNINLYSLLPALTTLILYILYLIWCYNSKTEVDEDEQ